MTETASPHRAALAQARRLWLHYSGPAAPAGAPRLAADLGSVVAALERACDRIDEVEGMLPPGGRAVAALGALSMMG